MKIKHYGRFMDVSDSLREYTEKKLSKLNWFFDPDAEGQVKYTQEKGGKNIVEITISHKGLLFRAEEATGDMYASVDKAVDKLSRQIRRHRTKLDKRLH
ncbi:MAG: ribosome-associated translation inhibitor RaiA, partial [Clostridia bacterium]|nr:ribosome-associated translation inhibitor RaiA [Clostridia bacterium]